MRQVVERNRDADKAAQIVRDAGGTVVGRTRLQKIAYLLEVTGLGHGFAFEYRHYGPYSEELTSAAWHATLLGLIHEEERPTSWGGSYSIFTEGERHVGKAAPAPVRQQLVQTAVQADPVALELAATAAFLAAEGNPDPWAETERRKPEKAAARLNEAKALYRALQQVDTPRHLPGIVQ